MRRSQLEHHGMSHSREYGIWGNMCDRCHNPNAQCYSMYGARGITVCDRWRASFDAFYADMGPRPSPKHEIDRIDGTKGYSPDNCRWATRAEQMENRCITVRLTIEGVTRTLNEWAEISGIDHKAIRERLRRGWSDEDAVYKPTWTRLQKSPLKTHCKHGHEFTPENTAIVRGVRVCRVCNRDRSRVWRAA